MNHRAEKRTLETCQTITNGLMCVIVVTDGEKKNQAEELPE